ncbi:hypothetical protein HZ994_07040 [Akkermansiaceae bacterium]|nr:hypothetical protein HZ994_07040 [Akkermansiaceae bacterium]
MGEHLFGIHLMHDLVLDRSARCCEAVQQHSRLFLFTALKITEIAVLAPGFQILPGLSDPLIRRVEAGSIGSSRAIPTASGIGGWGEFADEMQHDVVG